MKSRVATFLSLILCFSIMVPSLVQASSIPHKETVIFNSDSKDGTYEFDEKIEVNRVKYNLSTVEYKLVSTQKKQIEGEVTHVEKSAPIFSCMKYRKLHISCRKVIIQAYLYEI